MRGQVRIVVSVYAVFTPDIDPIAPAVPEHDPQPTDTIGLPIPEPEWSWHADRDAPVTVLSREDGIDLLKEITDKLDAFIDFDHTTGPVEYVNPQYVDIPVDSSLTPPVTSPEIAAVTPPSPYGLPDAEPDTATVTEALETLGGLDPGNYPNAIWSDLVMSYRIGFEDGQDAVRRAMSEPLPSNHGTPTGEVE